jgi:predicted porin
LYRVGGTPGAFSQNEIFGAGASYDRGSLHAAAAYEKIHNPATSLYDGTTVSSTFVSPASNPIFSGYESASELQVFGGGASYDLGPVTVAGVYTNSQFRNVVKTATTPLPGSDTFQDFQGSVIYNASPALRVAATYDYLEANRAHYSQLMAGVHYKLSKRTDLYTIGIYQHASGIDSTNKSAVANITTLSASTRPNQVAVTAGIIHTF